MESKVTPEQLKKLKEINIKATKEMIAVLVRLLAMLIFFVGATLVVSALFLPNSPGFIALANALGGIFALADAVEGSTAVTKEFREKEAKILKEEQ